MKKRTWSRWLACLLTVILVVPLGCGNGGETPGTTGTPTGNPAATGAPTNAPATPTGEAKPTQVPATPTPAQGEETTGKLPEVEETGMTYKLWYDEPAGNNYDEWEKKSLPVGNSSIGGNVFGRYDVERITLNEKTFWTGGPSASRPNYIGGNITEYGNYGETLAEVQRLFMAGEIAKGEALCEKLVGTWDGYGGYQLFGNLYLDFGAVTADQISEYSRELNIKTGIAGVSYKKNNTQYEREIFTSYEDNVMVLHLTAEGGDALEFVLSLEPENTDPATRKTSVTASGNQIAYRGTLDDNQLRFGAFLTVQTEGGSVSAKDGTKLQISGAKEVTVLLSMATDYMNTYPTYRTGETLDEVCARVQACVEAAAKKSYEELRAYHVADMWGMMDRAEINLGQTEPTVTTDALLAAYKADTLPQEERAYLEMLLFQYGRYLLVSSSRGETLPANLQGIWVGKNGSEWSSDYHINVNLQMNYWHAYNTNLAECALPLIDYVEGLRKPGRVTAEIYFGIVSDENNPENGFTANTQTTPFGWTCPGWSFDWGWSPAAVPWIIQNVWEYYEYTLDEEILKNEIYPIMKEQVVFYQQALVQDENGKWISTPSYSPEHGPRTNGNTYEQTLIWQLFTDTITAAKLVGEDAALIAEWQEVLDNLKDPVEIGTDGQIKEWYHETYLGSISSAENFGHRHLSHLLGLYPGDLISVETPEWLAAALVSMENRVDRSTGWAMGQRINTWARLGNGEKLYQLIGYLFDDGILDNLWDTHPPFQIDGNFGYSAGVAEALMQSNMGYINLLPALPNVWADGFARGLVARGNFELDMTWKDKAIREVKVLSNNGGTCTMQFEVGEGIVVKDAKGNTVAHKMLSDNRFSFETTAGESYTVTNTYSFEAPKDLSVKRVSDYETVLTWEPCEKAEGYAIFRSANGTDFTLVGTSGEPVFTDVTAVTMSFTDVYTYKVRATGAGNTFGAYSLQQSVATLNNEIIDGGDGRIVYSGDWSVYMENDHYNSTNHCSWTPGSAAELTFVGTGIELYSVAKSNYNAFRITVDGKAYEEYYSVYAPSKTTNTRVFHLDGLEYGSHKIRVEVLQDKVTPANDHSTSIDYFHVLTGAKKTPVESVTVVSENQVVFLEDIGETLQLAAEILPATADYKAVKWQISGKDGGTVEEVTISETGLVTVTGKYSGEVIARAVALDGSSKSGTITLQIATAEGVLTSRNHLSKLVGKVVEGKAYSGTYNVRWMTNGSLTDGRFAAQDNGSNVCFEFNLGEEKKLNTLLVYERVDLDYDKSNPGGGNSRFNTVEILTYNGSEWVTVASATADYKVLDNNTVLHELSFETIVAEKVRIRLCHNGEGTGGITVWEMEGYYRVIDYEEVDRSKLLEALSVSTLLTEQDFSKGEYAAFTAALEEAILCANESTADQKQVDADAKALVKALNGKKPKKVCTGIEAMVPSKQLPLGESMPVCVLASYDRGLGAVLAAGEVSFRTEGGCLTVKNGILTATAAGEGTVYVTYQGHTAELSVLVTQNK